MPLSPKKVSALVSMSSADLSPSIDSLYCVNGGESKRITPNNLFTGWGMTPAGAAIAKASDVNAQKDIVNDVRYQYTTALNTVTTTTKAVGTVRLVYNGGIFVLYLLQAGTDAQQLPLIVRPNDFNASTNAKIWKAQQWYSESNRSDSIVLKDTVIFPPTPGEEWAYYLPQGSGEIALTSTLVLCTTLNDDPNIYSIPKVDNFIYCKSENPISAGVWNLPGAGQVRHGQVVMLYSNQLINSVEVNSDHTRIGSGISSINPFELYAWKFIGETNEWLRLS